MPHGDRRDQGGAGSHGAGSLANSAAICDLFRCMGWIRSNWLSRMPTELCSNRHSPCDRGPVQAAALIIGGTAGQMDDRPVIPENHVVFLPFMGINELGTDTMRKQLLQDILAFILRQADD